MTERFNPRFASPDDLARLTGVHFRAVVDADLRRRVRPEGLRQDTSDALRSPDHVERWHAMLRTIKVSVEGQLAAAEDDFTAQAGALEDDITRLAGTDRAATLQEKLSGLRSGYLDRRGSRQRFLSSVNEHIAEAESLQTPLSTVDSGVVEERNRLRRRVSVLEQAIDIHRRTVRAELAGSEEPELYEEALWAVLGSDG